MRSWQWSTATIADGRATSQRYEGPGASAAQYCAHACPHADPVKAVLNTEQKVVSFLQ